MDIKDLTTKAQNGTLTEEELNEVLTAASKEIQALKEDEPEKYLELITMINDSLKEINDILRAAIAESKEE